MNAGDFVVIEYKLLNSNAEKITKVPENTARQCGQKAAEHLQKTVVLVKVIAIYTPHSEKELEF